MMKHIKYQLLACLLLIAANSASAKLPKLVPHNNNRVYSALNYYYIGLDRICNQLSIVLDPDDADFLNELFVSKDKNILNPISIKAYNEKGIYIKPDNYENDKDSFSYFIMNDCFLLLSDKDDRSYVVPKSMRPKLKEIIERYQKLLPERAEVRTKGYRVLSFYPPIRDLNKFHYTMTLSCYAFCDSNTIVQIIYTLRHHKKSEPFVWRRISLDDPLPADKANILKSISDSLAVTLSGKPITVYMDYADLNNSPILNNIVPKWKTLTAQERMEALDNLFLKHSSMTPEEMQKTEDSDSPFDY
jgi:hypothetical protein